MVPAANRLGDRSDPGSRKESGLRLTGGSMRWRSVGTNSASPSGRERDWLVRTMTVTPSVGACQRMAPIPGKEASVAPHHVSRSGLGLRRIAMKRRPLDRSTPRQPRRCRRIQRIETITRGATAGTVSRPWASGIQPAVTHPVLSPGGAGNRPLPTTKPLGASRRHVLPRKCGLCRHSERTTVSEAPRIDSPASRGRR